jgi:hypothetical protein
MRERGCCWHHAHAPATCCLSCESVRFDAVHLCFASASVRASASATAADALPRATARQDANGKWTGLQVSYQVRAAAHACASRRKAGTLMMRAAGGTRKPCLCDRVCRARTASRRRYWPMTAARPRRSTSSKTRSRCAFHAPARLALALSTCTLPCSLGQAVEQFLVDRAVLPIENSLGVRAAGVCALSIKLRLTRRLVREASTATMTCCCATGCTLWARRVCLLVAHGASLRQPPTRA